MASFKMNIEGAVGGKLMRLMRRIRQLTFVYYKCANSLIIRRNIQKGIFAVNICNHHGIGAKLVWALEIMAYCHEHRLKPVFRFTYLDKDVVPDHFGAFFQSKNELENHHDIQFAKIRNVQDLGLGQDYGKKLTLAHADQLIKNNLTIRPEILAEIDSFVDCQFGDAIVLGVHYRGTDKDSEAIKLSYAQVKRNIDYYLAQYPETERIFIASDEFSFIEYMKDAGISRPIIYRRDSYRSKDGIAVHHSGRNRIAINHDAIINCLLLSKCHALMKTASILSAWSKLFNPSLPLVMLSEPYDYCSYFPENALARDVLFSPIK